MKRLVLLFSIFSFVSIIGLQAQTCGHAKKTATTTAVSADNEAAARAASLDNSIERQVCAHSGKVSYYRKDVCEKSGKVSLTEVEYDAPSGKFVNVSPSEKAACSKGAAEKASLDGKKGACCAKGAKNSACCAKKGASSASVQSEKGEAVKVKSVTKEGTN